MRVGRRPREESPHRDTSAQLARSLRELRAQRSWTQQRLAQEAGLSYQAVRAIENNSTLNPGVFTLMSVTDALGVPLEEVLAQLAVDQPRDSQG